MSQTLLTGATGLLAHQRKLDVVANNIANLNTTGYKSRQVLFSDLIYSPLGQASGPNGDLQGGINPKQIGQGVQVGEISQNFAQGVMNNTGGQFDFAIEGDGFFVLGGDQQKFSRDGSFTLDRNGYLVDASTGSYVQRNGVLGESQNSNLGFQAPGDSRIRVPLGTSVPGRATAESSILGNLPSTSQTPRAEVLITAAPMTSGGSPATDATTFNSLDSNVTAYGIGDTIEIVGTNVDGSSFSIDFPANATTTLGDMVNTVNAQLTGASLAVSSEGNLVLTADDPGEALLSLNFKDAAGNTGETNFDQSLMVVETDGKAGDKVQSTIQVFDSRGEPHSIYVTFEKIGNNRWDAEFEPATDAIEMIDGSISEIIFTENGSFQQVNGSGVGNPEIQFKIDSLATPQTINFSFGEMTHLASSSATTFEQDGFPPGSIVSLNVLADGTLTGVASNGRQLDVAQMAVAKFSNNQGLESIGSSFYVQTSNSGEPKIGSGQSDGRGAIRGGSLENSNVDVALEFTQLIVAQRGFSANARSITVATEVLQELNNIF